MLAVDCFKKLRPVEFTCREGGNWLPWQHGEINQFETLARDSETVELRDEIVHALKFDDGRKWDCINGWGTNA